MEECPTVKHGETVCRKLEFEDNASSVHVAISQELIPQIGMEFQSEQEAFEFYNNYAKEIGFSVRKNKGHTDAFKNWLDRIYCCSREGKRSQTDKRFDNVKNHRAETRCGCLAMMKVNARGDGKFRVQKFISEHTHELATPKKRMFLRSQRHIDLVQGAELQVIEESGITPNLGVGFMARKVGGIKNLGFIPRDYNNYLRSRRSERMKAGDTGGVLEYLQHMQCEDPNFSYFIQVDIDDLITNVFWADSRMKLDYECFGDVACFDTTYKKNKEGRPLAVFVGVNNHKQSIIFGAALLYDETSETFMWLFDIFAKVMSGKKPMTILTDQDAAMAKALSLQWPETVHRLCVWHMYQNAAKHLSGIFESFKTFTTDLSSCVYDHDDEEDFLAAWAVMIEKYGLQSNTWLQKLFELKEKWALVYGRQTFCADMSTTQRSESMNSNIKRYVGYNNDLLQFFGHFQRLLECRRFKELEADFGASQSQPSIPHPVEVLQHAGKICTPTVYKLFEKEVYDTWNCTMHTTGVDGNITSYEVIPPGKPRRHVVMFDSTDTTVTCSCNKFEFVGILCAHALKVLFFHNVKCLPEKYILKRWTKDAKAHASVAANMSWKLSDPKKDVGNRYKVLLRHYAHLAARAALTEHFFEKAITMKENLLDEIEASLKHLSIEDCGKDSALVGEKIMHRKEHVVVDDQVQRIRGIKTIGRKKKESSKRNKSVLEIATTKKKRVSSSVGASSKKTKKMKQVKEATPSLDVSNSNMNDNQSQQSQVVDCSFNSEKKTD